MTIGAMRVKTIAAGLGIAVGTSVDMDAAESLLAAEARMGRGCIAYETEWVDAEC
jgi:hypothetical protein